MIIIRVTFFSMFLLLCAIGCERNDSENMDLIQQSEDDVILEVNGEPILRKEMDSQYIFFYKRFGDTLPADGKDENKIEEMIYQKLIDRKLIQQEAKRLNMVVTDSEIEQSIHGNIGGYSRDDFLKTVRKAGLTFTQWRKQFAYNLLIKKILEEVIDKSINIGDKELESYYEKNISEFDMPLKVRVLQIVLSTQEEAERVGEELLEGADFENLAKEKSIAPEGENGGDLGYFAEGLMPEEFDRVIFEMEPGEISTIVQTPYGFHIFKMVDKNIPEKVDKKKAFELITKRLYDEKRDLAFQIWKNKLIEKAVVSKKV